MHAFMPQTKAVCCLMVLSVTANNYTFARSQTSIPATRIAFLHLRLLGLLGLPL